MHNKIFLTVFGLIIAGVTAASSIAAATHPERTAELKHFALGVFSSEQESEVAATGDTDVSGREEVGEKSTTLREGEQDTSAMGNTSRDDDDRGREKEDEDEDEDDDDDRTGSVQTASSPATPAPTAPASTPTTPTAKTFTMAQVAAHHTSSDCYTTINGAVYNLTPFIQAHPGGASAISQLCGINGAALFQAQHGGQGKPEQELASLKIGVLVQ